MVGQSIVLTQLEESCRGIMIISL